MRAQTMLPAIGLALSLVLAAERGAHAVEVCGDGVDNDADSLADEGCMPAVTTDVCESPLDCGDTGAVSPGTSALTYELPPDIEIATPYGPPLVFRRTYTSLFAPGGGAPAYRKPMGERWQHNYSSWLDKNTTPSPDEVVLHTTDGQDVLFKFDSTVSGYDYYLPQAGFHFKHLRQATSSPYYWELKTLDGNVLVYDWSSPTGKLIEVRDSLATPNKLTITYNGSGLISKVEDATLTKKLEFTYTSNVLTQILYKTSTTTRVTMDYVYTGSDLTEFKRASARVHKYLYTSGYLTLVEDADANDVNAIYYASSASGQVVRTESTEGTVGYEINSPRTACSGKTAVYFDAYITAGARVACDDDADCSSGQMCGGETNPAAANTGVCFHAGRCLTVTSPSEDVVTTVAPLAPSGGTCDGGCTDVAEYSWDTASGKLDLLGKKDGENKWLSYAYNANGLPTVAAVGDSDNNPSNDPSGIRTWLYYDNASFPGLVTEVRRKSDGSTATCSSSVTTGCKRTLYTYSSDGLLTARQELGFTLSSSETWVAYDYTTSYAYDSKGRMTQENGPLSGSNDVTDYEYWAYPDTSDVLLDGYRRKIKRKKDSSNFLITELKTYDFWGNPTLTLDPDGTIQCDTYDANANYRTEARDAMNGQTTCTTHATDLVTSWVRDSWGRVTKLTRPDSGCVHSAYDSIGRLSTVKRRDDCNAGSSGDTMTYTYLDGRLVSKIEITDAASAVTRRQEYTYFESSRLKTVKDPVSTQSTTYTVDERGLVTQVDFPSSLGKTGKVYDAQGRQTQRKDYLDATNYDAWDFVYASLRKPTSITDEDAKATAPTYDDLGRRVRLVSPDSGTTLHLYDARGRVTTLIEAKGLGGEQTHTFTYDHVDRVLTEDYYGSCGAQAGAEMQYIYDAQPGTCPTGAGCALLPARLAYAKMVLFCDVSKGDDTWDQETFYSYDAGGRQLVEHVQDDGGGIAKQSFAFEKSGALTSVTTPSGAVFGWTYGTTGVNSDQELAAAVWKTSTSTPIANAITYYPFGVMKVYEHQNKSSSSEMVTKLTRNLAYRVNDVLVENKAGTDVYRLALTEDDKGRVTARDYTGGHSSLVDSYFLYDWLDRLTCERTTSGSTCPTSGSTLKNNINGSPPYTTSNDRDDYLHAIVGNSNYAHEVTLTSGKDQIASLNQTGTGGLGTTSFGYDARGSRSYDDNSAQSHDRRDYGYDWRGNVRSIVGDYRYSGTWHSYYITNAFDQKDRRVYKSFQDGVNYLQAHWYYYYDVHDRLTEIKYVPSTLDWTTYSIYQLVWLGDRLVAYYQTDYPSGTVSRRYVHTDETGRPIEMYSWPTSGDGTRVWAINPDAWGNDTVGLGSGVFQPVVFSGQYRDIESVALRDDLNAYKPALMLARTMSYDAGKRTYDSFTGTYLQADRSGYTFANNNPLATPVSQNGTARVNGGLGGRGWTIAVGLGIDSGYWEGNGNNCADIPESQEGLGCFRGGDDECRPPVNIFYRDCICESITDWECMECINAAYMERALWCIENNPGAINRQLWCMSYYAAQASWAENFCPGGGPAEDVRLGSDRLMSPLVEAATF